MAARKLQSEIDRTLKKVSEGVELFESIYDKMQASTNQTQKEKLELDLKTQIKKLQRQRDQIKTWVASNDIKDKSQLLENRRLIETQMEKFKACEKEMKTKAFSKEGLTQAAKLDPKEQEKEDTMQWLQTQVEELQMQVEQTEAEVETLQGTGKKRNKSGSTAAGRLEELESLNERRKWHVSRLEILLRLLNNGSLSTDKVLALKEDVQYFVESNTDEDFDEDEGIYDELKLDEEEEKFGLVNDDLDSDESDEASEDIPPRAQSKKHDEESVASSKRDESPILKKAAVTLQLRKPSVDTKPPPNINFAQQPMASILKAGLPQKPPSSTPIKYAAAAAAAVTPTTPSFSTPSQVIPLAQTPTTAVFLNQLSAPIVNASAPLSVPPVIEASVASTSPSLTHPSVTSPILSSSASTSQQPDDSFYSGQGSPALSETVPSSVSGPPLPSSPLRPLVVRKESVATLSQAVAQSTVPTVRNESTQQTHLQLNGSSQSLPAQSPSDPSPLPQQLQQYPIATQAGDNISLSSSTQQAPQFPPGVKVSPLEQGFSTSLAPQQPQAAIGGQRPPSTTQQGQQQRSTAFPGSLSDLVISFESVKQKATMRMNNLDQVHKMLESGYTSIPQPQDTEKPKYYVPKNPFQTPPYYPQTPHPLLSTAAIFSQLDVETLFYVFYYLPGTYQQYLAARELKRQSWRFHVKYLTWFQRHSEPQAITEEYEQGVYVYFDWEGSWCQRKKSDFRFEYRYLSEE
ncbi:Not1 N-terminal domain, CCR4-Not complex component domain containing protein [Amanita muscaria]